MTKPTPIAALLIAAFLSGTVVCAVLDRATAGQVAATASLGPSVTAPPEPRGRAYLFRGFAGMVFSRGTDKLADQIKQFGFMATVNEAMMCPNIIKEAIDDYRRDPALIILIGHSVGGACVLSFAEMLRDEHIPVSLLVTTEPARISHDVPLERRALHQHLPIGQRAWGYRRRAGARLSRSLCDLRSSWSTKRSAT